MNPFRKQGWAGRARPVCTIRDDPFGEGRPHRWGRGGPGEGWEGGGRGRRGGPLEQGDLRLLVLSLIARQPRHGYEIIKEIETLTGGRYAPSPGVVYPLLSLLEETGHIVAGAPEGGRKSFAVAPDGQAELDAASERVTRLHQRLADVAARGEQARHAAVLRAMENLKMALRLRLSSTAASDADALKIADILDDTAKLIERLPHQPDPKGDPTP